MTKRRKWLVSASSERSNSSNNEYLRTYTNLNTWSKELKESSGKLSPHVAARGKKGPRLMRSQRKSKETSEDSFDQIT